MDFEFEGMTLANIAGGRLEELFQELLAEVVQIDADAAQYQATKEGDVSCAVEITLAFTLNPETGMRTLVATTGMKRPKRKAVGNAFHIAGGAILVQPKLEQQPLFGENVKPIGEARAAREGE